MYRAPAKVITIIAASLLCVWPAAAHDDYDDHPHGENGPAQSIGKSADTMGQDIGKNAGAIGENAVKGTGGILNSVGQFLQGLGTDMNRPAQETTNAPVLKTTTPAEKTAGGAAAAPAAAGEPVTETMPVATQAGPDTKENISYTCPTCGQQFEVIGYPKGTKVFCPGCGKPID
ncbi:MAG TPA: hypothetical protein P5287_03100 [bacterium]|nr:hypothetical protein [bacterium]